MILLFLLSVVPFINHFLAFFGFVFLLGQLAFAIALFIAALGVFDGLQTIIQSDPDEKVARSITAAITALRVAFYLTIGNVACGIIGFVLGKEFSFFSEFLSLIISVATFLHMRYVVQGCAIIAYKLKRSHVVFHSKAMIRWLTVFFCVEIVGVLLLQLQSVFTNWVLIVLLSVGLLSCYLWMCKRYFDFFRITYHELWLAAKERDTSLLLTLIWLKERSQFYHILPRFLTIRMSSYPYKIKAYFTVYSC